MTYYNWTTVSKVIQSEVTTLQLELQRLLGSHLLGIYLSGSLALGGFNPARSDIDVFVVTDERLELELKRNCMIVLLRFSKMPSPIDMHFLVKRDLFPWQNPPACDLHYDEAHRETYQQDLRNGSWKHWNDSLWHDPHLTIDLRVLQRYGICLMGEPLEELLPVVPEQDFREALIKGMQEGWNYRQHELIAFVLNACRILAYLRNGLLLSKDAGGEWGLVQLGERYQPLIQQALALYRGERLGKPVGRPALESFAQTVLEEAQRSSALSNKDEQ